jgi:hypothetical protein
MLGVYVVNVVVELTDDPRQKLLSGRGLDVLQEVLLEGAFDVQAFA